MVHRLPAPIREEPTPAAKPKVKAKSEHQSQESKAKESKPSIKPFVGTWKGTIAGSFTSNVGLNVSANAMRTVIISSDGTVTYFGQSGSTTSPQSQSKIVLSTDGRSASWSNQATVTGGSGHQTCSLQLITPNAASYREELAFTSDQGNGNMRGAGTLTKQ
jgi:hypothetical protein